MCGSDTLTTVVSSTSMKVANITEMAMIQGLTSLPSLTGLSRVHRGERRHAGPEAVLGILAGIECDANGYALHHLHEVAGRVFWRKDAEPRAGCPGDALDLALERAAAVGIDFDVGPLPRPHVRQLG